LAVTHGKFSAINIFLVLKLKRNLILVCLDEMKQSKKECNKFPKRKKSERIPVVQQRQES
jgi:hypothetical protein